MASDQPVSLSPFAHFAHQPQLSGPSSSDPLPLRKSLRKRKATNPEGESSLVHLVPRQKKKQRSTSNSKVPGVSKGIKIYENLRGLDDHLQSGLDIIFCGINPGQKSSQAGHHYFNPTNHFWSCLHQSGFTSKLLDPRDDSTLPREFSIGLTNLVSRPTIKESELSKAEQTTGVSELMQKITQHQPRIMCFVGLGIAEIVNSAVTGKYLKSRTKTVIGLQRYKVIYPGANPCETLFYAVSSTSGRVVQYQKGDKVKQFTDLRVLVDKIKKGSLDTEGLVPINMKSSSTPVAP
jgi:TDG/mug DNA glycosylase family protein